MHLLSCRSCTLIAALGTWAGPALAAPARDTGAKPEAPPPLLDSPPRGALLDAPGGEVNLLPGAQEMPLDALVKHARDSAMRVRVARARLEIGDAAIAGAKPLLVDNPQLYVGAGLRNNNAGTNFEFQSTLTQPFEFGGERGLRIKAGRRYRDLLDRELAQIQWETYAQVHYAYNMGCWRGRGRRRRSARWRSRPACSTSLPGARRPARSRACGCGWPPASWRRRGKTS
jgi:hypothetical protein